MAYMAWDQKYSIGVKEIDAQHRKLVDMINDLHEAMKLGKGKEVMSNVLKGLVDYTASHFATEEKYMDKYKYPESTKHKGEHVDFVKKVLSFQENFNSGKVAMTLEVMNFLKDWLVKHILGTDMKFGPFLNTNGMV